MRIKHGVGFGGVVKREDKEIELLNRKLLVSVLIYKNGVQRCQCHFSDKNRSSLVSINQQLRKEITELEQKLKSKVFKLLEK